LAISVKRFISSSVGRRTNAAASAAAATAASGSPTRSLVVADEELELVHLLEDVLLELGAALGLGRDVVIIHKKGIPLPEAVRPLGQIAAWPL
jgi:hypothetical protein